ncbi:hypothetical protein B0O99DRAFT_668382 [Bisporella sp. PMI_857]|nr:hypothetical protein B0O99DRAFT_729468 [Bisporella sp. PMI_857]KAH8600442.1 hypothetical protein B0O99DRAFT_668382 [Bisporella sp. PMI_857]
MHLKGMDRLRSLWGYRNLNLNTDNDAYWSPREAVPKKFDYRAHLQIYSANQEPYGTREPRPKPATAANKLASKEFWLRNPPYRGLSTYGSYGYREDYRNAAINSQEEDFRMLNDPGCNGASDSRGPLQTRNMSHTQSNRPESQPSGLNQAGRAQNTSTTSTRHALQTPQARMEQITGGVNQLGLQQVRTSNPGNPSSESNPSQGGSLTRTTRQQYQGGYQNATSRQGTQYQYPNHRSSNSVATFSFGPAPTPIQPTSNSGIQVGNIRNPAQPPLTFLGHHYRITFSSTSNRVNGGSKIVLKADGMPSDIREKLRDALRRLGQDYNAANVLSKSNGTNAKTSTIKSPKT